ncbi:MAG: hypothetical protein CMI52_02010 [Parcubacteria group bacterium]|nr:hypothetical protein [Parcubacteria group bacterium]|tara:strand:+ start:2769 stop:3260 length:492 start_codon:yes stop_codon:yes gene_type:complete
MEEAPSTIKNKLFEFKYPSFEKHRRGTVWYIGALIVTVLLIMYALTTANFLFALLLVLFAFVVFIHDLRDPAEHTCVITDAGIYIDGQFHPYSRFTGFWLAYEPPTVKTLYLSTDGIIRSHFGIPMGDVDPIELRRWLRRVVLEDLERDDEPMSEQIARILKI